MSRQAHRDHGHAQHAAKSHEDHAASVGRTTLTEHLDEHVPRPDDPTGPAPDDPHGLETVYYDDHRNPHAHRFEHHEKHAERHQPKFDRYNRHTINDHASKHVAGRPGVVADGRGLFTINKAHATRYTFVRHGNTNIATPFDQIDRDEITTTNYKAQGKDAKDVKKHARLLCNPSKPRMLHIEGKNHLCVLTWMGVKSSAWIKVEDLVHGEAIARVAHARGLKEDPLATSHDASKLMHETKHYVVRNDRVGRTTSGDTPHHKDKVLGPGAKGGDDLPHYLGKDERKPAFDAAGNAEHENVSRSIVALVMNLPERDTPPIAIDTLLAGESFFVMKDSSFHRDTPVFRWGKRTSNLLERWVFGYVGMRDAQGHLRPDPTRRGWLPLRTLAEASHLHTVEIAPRKQ